MLSFMISLYGIVSDVDSLSMISVSHLMFAFAPSELRPKEARPRYVTLPPCFEIHFEMIVAVVSGARWSISAHAAGGWPLPAAAVDGALPLAPRPWRMPAGYFIVSFEPVLPATQSIVAFSAGTARFVARLSRFGAQ